jgi:predicted DNA-binding protein YlxM (UPF0122 family)
MDIAKTERMNRLLDSYGPLLTPHQQDLMRLYFQEDYSLGEIAEEYHISRNAVFSLLKRVEEKLIDFEEKLGLLALRDALQEALNSPGDEVALRQRIEALFNR